MQHNTHVSIVGDAFHINGRPTYEGREYRGMKIEGLLMNSRMVQGIFDDRNPETRSRWDYPDGPWDPDRNTRQFVEAMPAWRSHGLLGLTINLQGGNPRGYSKQKPWHNSAFEADGSLREDYLGRLALILDKANELGMAVILGLFYFAQDQRLTDEAAVIRGAENVVDWITSRGDNHVIIEIANEANQLSYAHPIIGIERGEELIGVVQQRSAGKVAGPHGRLLVSTSLTGGKVPPDNVVAASDFLLLHGNGVGDPDGIRRMVDQTRDSAAYRGQPILFNEDDHFDFDADDNNFVAAVSRYAGWGYFDYRMGEEGFDEGYQSVPVNWGISSDRKRGFFNLLAEMTGAR